MTTREEMAEAGRVLTLVADNPGPLTLDGSRTYVVGEDPCLVIDPGPALGSHLDAVEVAVGAADVAAVCVTHWHPDHAAGAAELVARLAAPLAAMRQSTELAALDPPEISLADGAEIDFAGGRLRTIAAPGHSPEHVCFHWLDAGALFTGDTILGEGTSMIAPPEGNMAAYMNTLERLLELEPSVIYPGHGPPIDEPLRVIEEYIAHRREREHQVLAAIAAGAQHIAEIRARVYPQLDQRLHRAAEGSVLAHLEKLAAEGRVAGAQGAYRTLE